MNSYIQYIAQSTEGANERKWMGELRGESHFRNYLQTLNTPDMLRFCIDQSVAVSIFFWLYGAQAHEFMTSYSLWLSDFTKNVLGARQMDANEQGMYDSCCDIQENWYGSDWKDVPIKMLAMYVYQMTENERDINFPKALSVSSFVPYLMQRNHIVQDDCAVWPYEVSLPRFIFSCGMNTCLRNSTASGYVSSFDYRIGIGFTAKTSAAFKEIQDRGAVESFHRFGYTLLEYIAKTNLTGKTFDSILSTLSCLCLHYDTTRVISSNFQLCYAVTAILNNLFSADFIDISENNGNLAIDNLPNSDIARSLLSLLGVANRVYGVKVASRDLFVRFFGSICDKDKKCNDVALVVNYVKHHGTNVASAEEFSAYKRSPLAGTEAIDFISQNATTPQDRVPEETEVNPDDGEEENIDLSDLPELDDAEPGLEADQEPADEDQDTSTDGDGTEGKDDPSSGEEESDQKDGADSNSEEEDASGEEDPSSGDTDGAGDAGADSAAGGTDTPPNAEPEDIDASDEDGISFEIAPEGSETVDSVVFREELDRFLSDVLANPPKKLSPQAVNALTVLQKNWVHILRVETIVGILEKVIALPEKFKTIKNLHGENS